MLKALLVLCVLVWLPIFLRQIAHRGFLVLLIWLFVTPVASNLVKFLSPNPYVSAAARNPFFEGPASQLSDWEAPENFYVTTKLDITLDELLEPTRVLFGLFLVGLLFEALVKKKSLVPLDRTEIWMGVFSLILMASVLLQSKRTGFGLRLSADAFIIPFLAYYITRRLVTSEEHFRKLTQVIGFLGFYLIVIGLIERLVQPDPLHRLHGPFPVRDDFYETLMVVFFMVLVDWISKGLHGKKSALSLGVQRFVLTLCPAIIFLTWTRGLWIGFLLGVGTFAFLSRNLLPWRRKLLIMGIVLIFLPIAVLGYLELTQVKSVSSRFREPDTVHGRLATYRVVINEVFRRPVFGIGLNNLRDVLAEPKWVDGAMSYATAHQSFLAMLAELGMIGLFAYLAMAASILGTGFQVFRMEKLPRDRWRGVGVIAIMVGFLIPGMFDTELYSTSVCHVYVFACFGAVAGLYASRQTVRDPHISSSATRETPVLTR